MNRNAGTTIRGIEGTVFRILERESFQADYFLVVYVVDMAISRPNKKPKVYIYTEAIVDSGTGIRIIDVKVRGINIVKKP